MTDGTTTTAGDTTTGTTTTAATTTAAAPWHNGMDAEVVAKAQGKGWKLDDPKVAFEAVTKAYIGAEKMIGIRPEELLRLPQPNAPTTDLDAFWSKLGAVKEAKDIDLSGVKSAAGTDIDAKLADAIRAAAVTARAPKEVAVSLAKSVQKALDDQSAEMAAIRTGQLNTEKENLNKAWGANRPAYELAAKRALETLGKAVNLNADQIKQGWDAISSGGHIGGSYAMMMLLGIAQKMGEGNFVAGSGGPNDLQMTPAMASARKAELMKDSAWVGRYMAGDVRAKQEMEDLNRIIVGVPRAA